MPNIMCNDVLKISMIFFVDKTLPRIRNISSRNSAKVQSAYATYLVTSRKISSLD